MPGATNPGTEPSGGSDDRTDGQVEGHIGRRYQVALSYADADEEYVGRVAAALGRNGIRFFDERTARSTLWGELRPAQIEHIYTDEADHVILFVSHDYVTDPSVSFERSVVVGLAAVRGAPFALPASFDDSKVPGLPSGIIDIPLAGLTPEEFAGLVCDWLKGEGSPARQAVTSSGLHAGWEDFDTSAFHTVVVGSEVESAPVNASATAPSSLGMVFNKVLASPSVWKVVVEALHGQEVLGGTRTLPADYSNNAVRSAAFSVVDAFANGPSLDRAVRLVIEADAALFDVTGFEPGVMMLLGMRAATRRGVTITSYGGMWKEGSPLPRPRPFNLADLSIASHALSEPWVGEDPRIARLSERLRTGFEQFKRHPHYHDLPVFDALRRLGTELAAWQPIPLDDEVLVLCSYDHKYFDTWQSLALQLSAELLRKNINKTRIARLQDFATPQIVSQALYEKIRRCVACVVDWTHSSPSTFFELGVRLVISQWGTVQIVDGNWFDTEIPADGGRRQLGLMRNLFHPLSYPKGGGEDLGTLVVEALDAVNQSRGSSGHRLQQVAARALSRVEPKTLHVSVQLREEADRLDNLERARYNVPQSLFYEVPKIKEDHEHAALERRLAAWLYLEHRVGAAQRDESDPLKVQWRELGQQVADDLLRRLEADPLTPDLAADFELAIEISEKVKAE
jgi:hypothetical protein